MSNANQEMLSDEVCSVCGNNKNTKAIKEYFASSSKYPVMQTVSSEKTFFERGAYSSTNEADLLEKLMICRSKGEPHGKQCEVETLSYTTIIRQPTSGQSYRIKNQHTILPLSFQVSTVSNGAPCPNSPKTFSMSNFDSSATLKSKTRFSFCWDCFAFPDRGDFDSIDPGVTWRMS